jgi:16S rRNA (guanine(1405)-N(7))-methyltransferase
VTSTGAGAASPARPEFGRKYRDLAPELLERVWREASEIEKKPADALKRAKRALHQLHSAFVQERELDMAERAFAKWAAMGGARDTSGASADVNLSANLDEPTTLAACRAVLACHASTRERLPSLEPLQKELRARIGTPRSVLDLGCGLQPFTLPWLGLPRDAIYHARDCDRRMLALVGRFFERVGQVGTSEVVDLIALANGDASTSLTVATPPLPTADVAFLFKLLPTLERQRAGAAAQLLARLDCRVAVLSFPTVSLGARAKGMADHYAAFCSELVAAQRWRSSTFEVGHELFAVIEKR